MIWNQLRHPPWLHLLITAAVVLVVYVPDIGRGFVKDDFGWIVASQCRTLGNVERLFVSTSGFYRPLVSLSFAANEYVGGTNPVGYGATNLALAVLTALSVAWVVRSWRFSAAACIFAAALWILNPHGINMAVLWISGRTALLLTLFSVLAAVAASRDRPFLSALFAFLGMLSKEEAVLLPLALLVLLALHDAGRRRLVTGGVYFAAAWIAYFVLRAHSNAMTPATAPLVYRFTFAPSEVARNVAEYADRACTFTLASLVLLAVISRTLPRLDGSERRLAATGVFWLISGFALTVFLPVRSSLYACFPSVGAVWAGAAIASSIWRSMRPDRRRSVAIAAVLLPVMLIPVYRVRNVRWTELADLTSRVMPTLASAAQASPDGDILLVDERSTRVNIAAAFDGLLVDAITLACGTGKRTVWLVPPEPGAPPTDTVPRRFTSSWRLEAGRLVREDGSKWVGVPAAVYR